MRLPCGHDGTELRERLVPFNGRLIAVFYCAACDAAGGQPGAER